MTAVDTDLNQIMEELAEDMRLTHIVTPADNPDIWALVASDRNISPADVTSQMIVDFARGCTSVKALCGYEWIPKYNPEKYDTCGACLEEAHNRMENG